MQIRNFTAEDVPEVLALANAAFGENYLTREKCESVLESMDGGTYLAARDEEDILIGYIFFVYEDAARLAEKFCMGASELLPYADRRGRVCHTWSMAVIPEARNGAAADMLFSSALKQIADDGLRSAWGSAWEVNGRVRMDKIFRRYGFAPQCRREMLWYDDESYICVKCGGRCRCPAVIYANVCLN
jgi:ribosomal protein S18 acetylase RimI-like enzyme